MNTGNSDIRPWGKFEILLEESHYKVKKIEVKPGQRLSLQYHHKRSEVWVVVQGEGIITRGEDLIRVQKGSFVDIPIKAKHRVENTGSEMLVFIEVQNGEYLGEDDIVRIEDDYKRV
jgi:mannose-6-phosphate isomerase